MPVFKARQHAMLVRNGNDKADGADSGVAKEFSTNTVLRQLPPNVMRKLSPFLKRVPLAYEDYLFRPDEEMDFIYFPETAVVSEFQILEDGRTIEVAMTGMEGAIGVNAIYCPERKQTWTQVCAAGTAMRIALEDFRREARNPEVVGVVLHDQLGSYIRQISQKVVCNAHHSVEQRFCTWLLMLQDRTRTNSLRLTQEQIARVLGVYRPSVTCIAQDLRGKKAIDYVRGRIFIKSREALEKLSCSCYGELGISSPEKRSTLPVDSRTAAAGTIM